MLALRKVSSAKFKHVHTVNVVSARDENEIKKQLKGFQNANIMSESVSSVPERKVPKIPPLTSIESQYSPMK